MKMQGQPSNICYGCLAGGRRMLQITDSPSEKCYLQILKEVSHIHLPNSLTVTLCWECEANITRFTKFKLQVKNAYEVLNDYSIQQEIPQQKPKLDIHQVFSILLSPEEENNEINNIHTENIKTEQKHIKYEEDDDDNQPLIDICTDPEKYINDYKHENIDIDSNHVNNPVKTVKSKRNVKINGKLKRNVKLKNCNVNRSLFNEIELTEEEILKERNKLILRDDYVDAMFRCESCLISFPNEEDMKEHQYKKHELYASKHKCNICSCSFKTEVVYKYHQKQHARRYECAQCGYRCTSKLQARNHTTLHIHSVSYDVELKNGKGCELGDNSNDIDGMKEEKFPCDHCPKVFGWKTSLRKHMETHKIEAGQKRRPYCEPCRLSFTTTSNLQKHVKTSSKHQIQLRLRKLKESNPEESTDGQIEAIKSSVNSKRATFPCAHCDKAFQWRGNLLRHLHTHNDRASGALVCAPCGLAFASRATRDQHLRLSRKHVSEDDYKYMCSECGRKFANRTKLKEHVNWEHLKNFVHTCTDCQKVFKSHTSLYLHRQVVHHKASAQHLCENCGKSFPNHTKLRAHIIALHTSESPYKCNICSARFSWHSCLSRHMRRVHRTDK